MLGWRYRRGSPFIALIGAVVVLVPALVLGARAFLRAVPFIGAQPRAAALCRACAQAPVDGTKPYRIGRVLAAQHNGIALGNVMGDARLAGIAAVRPSEVGTLICAGQAVSVTVGVSERGAPLTRQYRDICLVDWRSGEVLYRTSLAGSQPFVST